MDRVKIYTDKAGEWRWSIVAPNEDIIDSSTEGFTRQEDARRNLIRAGHGALVGEESPDPPED